MKERSKTAARTRRENENAEFEQLAKLLPLPANVTSHLDKASVIRLTTSYLKMRELFPAGLGEDWGAEPATSTDSSHILKELSSHLLLSLDGFVFMLDPDGKVIYVSETASVHLGLSQIEMTGNNIYDFIHQSDYEEMRSILSPEFPSEQKCIYENLEIQLKFCLRMKCVLAKRNAGLAVDGYKVIHCSGYLKLRKVSGALNDSQLANGDTRKASQQYQVAGLVAIGQSLPSSSITDIKMSSHTFMFRASLDFTLVYLGARITAFTGYEPHKMVDKTLYQFVHCSDCLQLQMEHRSLLIKGQVITKYYRLLTKSGEWIWIQSYCTLINNNKSSKPHCIVALNHVISGQGSPEIMDSEQALYEQLQGSYGATTKPCSKRLQKGHQKNKAAGVIRDDGHCILNENSNNCSITPPAFGNFQSAMQVVQNNGPNDLQKIKSYSSEISSTKKLTSGFVSEDFIDKSGQRMRSITWMNGGPYAKNVLLINGDAFSELNQNFLNSYSCSSESNSPENNTSMASNYIKTKNNTIPYAKSLTCKTDPIAENGSLSNCHYLVNRPERKGLTANKNDMFPHGIYSTETSLDFANENIREPQFFEKVKDCSKIKILSYQSILPAGMKYFNEKKTDTEKKTAKRKMENKKDCNKLKRVSASRNKILEQQLKLGGHSSYGDNNNNYFANPLAVKSDFPVNEISCADGHTPNSCVQDVPADDLKHDGTMTGSNFQFPYFNKFLDIRRSPAVEHDHPGAMVHSTCYEMLRAASNSGFDANSPSISYGSSFCCSGNSFDLNAKLVLADNAAYDSPSFRSTVTQDNDFRDQLYLNCDSFNLHYGLQESRTVLSKEISPSTMSSCLEYESFSADSAPMSNDDNSSHATVSIDSDHQAFSSSHYPGMDLNTPPNENGTDICEMEPMPFEKPGAIFAVANKDSSAFTFDGTPSNEPMFENFTSLTAGMENESFSDVDCNWLSNPYLAGCDLNILRRTFSGSLHGQNNCSFESVPVNTRHSS